MDGAEMATHQATRSLKVDIVSDVVCPWCVIGFKQLERALREMALTPEIRWRPFELNPDMPAEGENLRAHLARKYGTTPEGSRAARARLTAMGAEFGFTFAYTDDMRMVNTFRAHQLLRWARGVGREHALKMALFSAFFSDRRDLNETEELVAVASSIGLDATDARSALLGAREAAAVRQEQNYFLSQGVRGVPAVIFEEKYLVTGAVGVVGYKQILSELAAKSRPEENWAEENLA